MKWLLPLLLLVAFVQSKLTFHTYNPRFRQTNDSYNRNCFFSPAACLLYKPEDALRAMTKIIDRDSPHFKMYRSLTPEDGNSVLVAWLTRRR